jgi:hypothetical protein
MFNDPQLTEIVAASARERAISVTAVDNIGLTVFVVDDGEG